MWYISTYLKKYCSSYQDYPTFTWTRPEVRILCSFQTIYFGSFEFLQCGKKRQSSQASASVKQHPAYVPRTLTTQLPLIASLKSNILQFLLRRALQFFQVQNRQLIINNFHVLRAFPKKKEGKYVYLLLLKRFRHI